MVCQRPGLCIPPGSASAKTLDARTSPVKSAVVLWSQLAPALVHGCITPSLLYSPSRALASRRCLVRASTRPWSRLRQRSIASSTIVAAACLAACLPGCRLLCPCTCPCR
ncbi:hypothetical protein Zm00014a_015808 [Zea mays]|uniref:Uncharacterized protein n=1 Tax=Zea mays TaxID=4577 RepID=A0A3L6F9G9_MAIZE|nr:hypothetical protein Zm00014a_015808 [Zea mays]